MIKLIYINNKYLKKNHNYIEIFIFLNFNADFLIYFIHSLQ